jgi:hypothetical protein
MCGNVKGVDEMTNVPPEATSLKKRSLLQRIWAAESYAFVLALIMSIVV